MDNVSQDRSNSNANDPRANEIEIIEQTENRTDFNIHKQIHSFSLAIGVLHTIWLSKNNKVYATNMGTAFAIAPHLIITCTHNVYTNRIQDYGTKFQFVPGIKQGQKPSAQNIHNAKIINRVQLKRLLQVKFQVQPFEEELTILQLEKTIAKAQLPQLGNLQRLDFDRRKDNLNIAGYPSMYIQQFKFIDNSTFKLVERSGKVAEHPQIKKRDYMIHYQIQTANGLSGSPIFVRNQQNKVIVIGIHTHSGKSLSKSSQQGPRFYNSGLYFTEKILQKIKQLDQRGTISFWETYAKPNQINKKYQYPPDKKEENNLPISQQLKNKQKKPSLPRFDKIPLRFNLKNKNLELQKKKDEIEIPQKQQQVAVQKDIKEDQQKSDDEEESYLNKSAISMSILEQSFQNSSQISKGQYQHLIEEDLSILLKLQEQNIRQHNQKYQPQSDYATDLCESTFVYLQ